MALINCPECGKEVSDQSNNCPNCGYPISNNQFSVQQPMQSTNQSRAHPDDQSSIGFAILSFFLPIIGLILWLVWRDEKPLKAGSAGKGALAGVVINILFWGII